MLTEVSNESFAALSLIDNQNTENIFEPTI